MAHPLAFVWKSKVKASADKHGDFDFRDITNSGDLSSCTHGPNKDRITGVVDEINVSEAPTAKFLVQIDQEVTKSFHLHYRGVAIAAANGEIHAIVGFKRAVAETIGVRGQKLTKEAEEAVKSALEELKAQDEGTWTGTQP
jgi:hypothetical protein